MTIKLHPAVAAHGMPVRMLATAADCIQAEALIDDITAERLLADRGYDTNAVLAAARARGVEPALPPKGNRKVAREYDRALYLAICQIRALALWAKII